MPREIQDSENTIWSCVEAYAGLNQDAENKEAARVDGSKDLVTVVCTPRGGAQTVRLELKSDWETELSDEDLISEIETQNKS